MRRMLIRLFAAAMLLAALTAPNAAASPKPTDFGRATVRDQAPAIHQPATPASPRPPDEPTPIAGPDGTIDIGPVIREKDPPLDQSDVVRAPQVAAAEPITYTVGMTRTFVVLNSVLGVYQRTTYDVKLISDTVEVWVQSDLRYRNPDGSINFVHPDASDPSHITPARIATLAAAAERIIPLDVEYFGDYASRDGSNATLPPQLGLPNGYYAGPGKRVIILVSNVRDPNFYDPINNPSYTAGFFSPTVNAFAGRNIITIDSKRFDRNVGPPTFQNEATIAHEFQHLINGDQDQDEDTWANEGRSEFAEFLNGYRPTPERHRTQWSDFPENSLTVWRDQDGDPDQNFEVLADYQQAYWFFLYLAGRLRDAGIGTANDQYLKEVAGLTKDPANGVESIDAMLTRVGAPFRFVDIWNDFRIDMLFGGTSDETEWGSYISQYPSPSGVPIAPLDVGRMRRNLDFEGYDTPGAPPIGSDYIEIGWSPEISTATMLNFNGETEIPTGWQVIPADDTGIAPGAGVSGNVLYSGHANSNDNFLIFPLSVPSGNATLSFDTLYNIEETWDFGFTQVTTDTAGATGFVSLPISGTTSISDTNALPIIQANVPGFSGVSGSAESPAWVHVTYDLSAYAGQDILLAFRYSTDSAAAGTIPPPPEPGWYLDNVRVGNLALYTDQAAVPAAAQSIWQARNLRYSFKFDIATFADENGPAVAGVLTSTLDISGDGSFDLGALRNTPGFDEAGERVVALVSSVAPPAQPDIIGQPGYGNYQLTGLPPSLYTSRARAIGTASNTSLSRPRVYPGDTFTMTVTLDNLGRNDDLHTTGPTPAYVAVPIPDDVSFVTDSLSATVATSSLTYTADLQSLDSGLPAGPGVYWTGDVTRTADLSFQLRADEPLRIGTLITPTAYIANGPFGSSPPQSFTDIEQSVQVVSPLELSTGTGPASVTVGSTATFTYTLINTDDQPRDVKFDFSLPDNTTLLTVTSNIESPSGDGLAVRGTDVSLAMTVPSYIQTGNVLVVGLTIRVDPGFTGTTLDPGVRLLQPDSQIPYNILPVSGTAGAPGGAPESGTRLYLPAQHR
jgi:hypothetical protein